MHPNVFFIKETIKCVFLRRAKFLTFVASNMYKWTIRKMSEHECLQNRPTEYKSRERLQVKNRATYAV